MTKVSSDFAVVTDESNHAHNYFNKDKYYNQHVCSRNYTYARSETCLFSRKFKCYLSRIRFSRLCRSILLA